MEQLIVGITGGRSRGDPVVIIETPQIIDAAIAANIPNNLTRQGAIAFVGRTPELAQLHDLLQQETPVALCAVQGMGGIGKTELALQFAYQERDR
ncbi:MAG: ATP-binding protein [Leptolyngbyaceae cyanobacterium CSU_1_4]|nr:ATP-binding protein [Leptolyngbyaceae cyanobacterium CSU_1_4]